VFFLYLMLSLLVSLWFAAGAPIRHDLEVEQRTLAADDCRDTRAAADVLSDHASSLLQDDVRMPPAFAKNDAARDCDAAGECSQGRAERLSPGNASLLQGDARVPPGFAGGGGGFAAAGPPARSPPSWRNQNQGNSPGWLFPLAMLLGFGALVAAICFTVSYNNSPDQRKAQLDVQREWEEEQKDIKAFNYALKVQERAAAEALLLQEEERIAFAQQQQFEQQQIAQQQYAQQIAQQQQLAQAQQQQYAGQGYPPHQQYAGQEQYAGQGYPEHYAGQEQYATQGYPPPQPQHAGQGAPQGSSWFASQSMVPAPAPARPEAVLPDIGAGPSYR